MFRLPLIGCAIGCTLACNTESLDPSASAPSGATQVFERRVNTYTQDRQQDPSLATDRGGKLLAVWSSRRQEGGTFGIFAQYLDPLGRPLGSEIHVNQIEAGHQTDPAAAFAADGSAWIVWSSIGPNGISGIRARRFAPAPADGLPQRLEPAGHEFAVGEPRWGDQLAPTVEANPAGGVLVGWIHTTPEGDRAVGRRFTEEGAPLGAELLLGSALPGESERQVVLASLAGRSFAVAWAAVDRSGRPLGIRARILGPEASLGGTFEVHAKKPGQQVEPCLASNGRDRFAVAWMNLAEATRRWTPCVRQFRADGKALSDEIAVLLGPEGHSSGAVVAMAPDGRFAVAWNLSGAKRARPGHRPVRATDIFGQCFDTFGRPSGEPFRVNRAVDGEQTLQVGLAGRRLVWTEQGALAFGWHGSVDGDARGIGLTLIAPAELSPPSPEAIAPQVATGGANEAQVGSDGLAMPERDPAFVPEPWSPPLAPRGGAGGFRAFTQSGWIPADPDLAVGPGHIVATVNVNIKFFTKDGVELYSNTLHGPTGFFGSVGAELNAVGDPVSAFDPLSQRFVVAAAERDSAGRDLVNIAMSDDHDPMGVWHKYRFDLSGFCDLIDFPNLGVGPDAVYVATDCFGGTGNWIIVFPKAPMMNGLPFTPTQVQTSVGNYSLGCVKTYDAAAEAQFFAAAWNGRNIRFHAITDPLGAPVLHTKIVGVDLFKNPPDADQLGSTNQADTVDWRIKNGVYRNGRLWLAHTIGAGGQEFTARVRWYEFDMNGWPGNAAATPVEIQHGTLNYGPYEHNWFPDIHVDDLGNAVIAFNRSSPSQHIGIECVSRMAGDPPGWMGPPIELQRSTSPETGNRWGDYSAVEEDAGVPGTFWSHTMYRTSSWRTWIGEFFTVKNLALSQTALISGWPATFTVENAEPGETVTYLYSIAGVGAGPCVPSLGGLCLDLLQPVRVTGTSVADATGVANLVITVPSTAPSITVWSQAVVQRGTGGVDSLKSNFTEAVIL